jgi:guanylate kinase
VGKKTLLEAILKKYGDLFEKKKSITTRKPREGENMDGFDFVSAADF